MASLVRTEPRRLGSLPEIGPISYGLWRFTGHDPGEAQLLIETALDSGMNLIDTADIYGFDGEHGFGTVEERLGEVLARAPHLRDRMVLATKGGIRPPVPYDSSAAYLSQACDDSLRRLGVDVIDLYQIHRPDPYTHPAEVAATLTRLREQGKIREVGVSNHTVWQTMALQDHLEFSLVSVQPEFSAVVLDPMRDGTLDWCTRTGAVPLAWSPLGGGRLATGEGIPEELRGVLAGIAERESVEPSQVALAFVLAHPAGAVPIIGTQQADRISSSAHALDVTLDRSDVYAIVQASDGRPLP